MKQKYLFSSPTDIRHYTADAFIVRCFDDRFRPACEKFLARQKIKHADVESPAGGAKVFASPERKSDREFLFRELEKSMRLHHAARVILFGHADCGAYGGIARFGGDDEKQFQFHAAEHKKAADAIRLKFPTMRIEGYFIDGKGVIKIL